MEEIRLWKLKEAEKGSLGAEPLAEVNQSEKESQLEKLLVHDPDLLMPNLTLVGRQTPTEGGALDLLGVDEDGNLVVFELKRGKLTRDAVTQVIDYASYLASLDANELAKHISERSGSGGVDKIEDFESWHQETFPNNADGLSNPPRMVLVGLGIDDRARRMVEFLSQSGVNISIITFHAFADTGHLLLARQVEKTEKKPVTRSGYTKKENLEVLKSRAERAGSAELLEASADLIKAEISHAYQWPSHSGYTFYLPERTEGGAPTSRAYVSIYVSEARRGQVEMVFQKRAVHSAQAEFDRFLSEHEGRLTEKKGNYHLWLKSESDLQSLRSGLKQLFEAFVKGWEAANRKGEEEAYR